MVNNQIYIAIRMAAVQLIAAFSFTFGSSYCYTQDRISSEIVECKIDRVIRIPVHIKGEPYLFVLDTGASVNAVDTSIENMLGHKIREVKLVTSSGVVTAPLFELLCLKVGKHDLSSDYTVVLDLKWVEQETGIAAHGVVGATVLSDDPIEFNLQAGIVQIRQQPSFNSSFSMCVILDRFKRPFVANVLLGSLPESLLLDTGFDGAMGVTADALDRLVAEGEATVEYIAESQTVGDTYSARHGTLKSVKFGESLMKDVPITESMSNKLGLAFLRKYHAFLDASRGVLELKESSSFDKSFE